MEVDIDTVLHIFAAVNSLHSETQSFTEYAAPQETDDLRGAKVPAFASLFTPRGPFRPKKEMAPVELRCEN